MTRVKDIDLEFKVAEALEALAPQCPLECVQVAHLMALADREGWDVYASEKHFKVITTAIASGSLAAKAATDDLIQYFLTRGQFSYRALLQ